MSTPITATGYYLEMVNAQHNKFYVAIVAERFALTNWGAIGSVGQSSCPRQLSVEDAEAVVRRQAYQKAAKGYTMLNEGLKFRTNFDELMKGNWSQAIKDFHAARQQTPYAAQTDVLVRDYEEFGKLLRDVMAKVDGWSGGSPEQMMADYDQIRTEWAKVTDAHSGIATQIGLLGEHLVSKMVGA